FMARCALLLFVISIYASPITGRRTSAAETPQSPSRILFADRVYQRTGPSHVEWMEIRPPDPLRVKVSDAEKNSCTEQRSNTISTEDKAPAERSLSGKVKLLAWSG